MSQRVEASHLGNACTLYNRGFTIDFLSRTGKLAFWKLSEYFTYCRMSLLRHPDCLTDNGQRLMPESALFVVVVDYQMTREFYRRLRDFIEKHTLTAKTELLNFTRSALVNRTSVSESGSAGVLCSLRFTYVLVDKETRRSKPLPDWFVKKYGKSVKSNESIERYILQKLPDNENLVFRKQYRINASDIDFNQHTNNAVYYRLCFDAATEASLNGGLFAEMPGDIGHYDVRRSRGVYMKECRFGDMVEIAVWQDTEARDTLHFQVDKLAEGDTRIPLFRTTIHFYLNQAHL